MDAWSTLANFILSTISVFCFECCNTYYSRTKYNVHKVTQNVTTWDVLVGQYALSQDNVCHYSWEDTAYTGCQYGHRISDTGSGPLYLILSGGAGIAYWLASPSVKRAIQDRSGMIRLFQKGGMLSECYQLSPPVLMTGSPKAVHVLSSLCDNASKRSLAICRKRYVSVPI